MAKYVHPEDYIALFNVDLNDILPDGANPSNKAEIFLGMCEDVVTNFINSNFAYTVEGQYPTFSDFQKEHWKKAILWEAHYLLKNGELHNRSGFEEGRGFIATQEQINDAICAPETKQNLVQCGLWNTHISSRGVIMGGFYSGTDGWGV